MDEGQAGRRVRLYYYDEVPNMGDLFNIDICRMLLGTEPIKSDERSCEAAFCGSILGRFLEKKALHAHGRRGPGGPVHIWGSGFIGSRWTCAGWGRKLLPEVPARRLEVHAVRGRMTRDRLQRLTGEAYGGICLADPGLLARELAHSTEKAHHVGVVVHYAERGLAAYWQFRSRGYVFIDPSDPPAECIGKIARCEYVLSSSLHGMVFADSLGVPNARLVASDRIKGGSYKFDDYYSSFDKRRMLSVDLRKERMPGMAELFAGFDSRDEEIEEKVRQLKASFPFRG